MTKHSLFSLFRIFLFSAILCFSCEGPEGPVGPAGEDGQDGAQGPAGQDGTDGQNGAQGHAGQDGTDGQDGADGNTYLDSLITFDDGIPELFTTEREHPWGRFVGSFPGSTTSSINDTNKKLINDPALTDNDSSRLFLTLDMPISGICSFDIEIDSELDGDFLLWYLNGELIDGISGEGGPFRFHIKLEAGPNEIEWQYTKNASISDGADLGSLDNVLITNYTAARMHNPQLPVTVSLYSDRTK